MASSGLKLLLFLLQGGEYPIRALSTEETDLVLERIYTRAWSGTEQIFTDNPLLRYPFRYGPHFWEGKWRSGYGDDLWEWVDLNGGEWSVFGKRLAVDAPESDLDLPDLDENDEEEVGPSAPPEPEARPVDTGQGS